MPCGWEIICWISSSKDFILASSGKINSIELQNLKSLEVLTLSTLQEIFCFNLLGRVGYTPVEVFALS